LLDEESNNLISFGGFAEYVKKYDVEKYLYNEYPKFPKKKHFRKGVFYKSSKNSVEIGYTVNKH
jgi:hypothetical protein